MPIKETYKNKYWKYFDDEGFIIGNLLDLPRVNSPMPMSDSRERFYEILKLDGDKEIRFAVQRHRDCGCRNFIIDSSELVHTLNYLEGKCKCVPGLLDEGFDFTEQELYKLKEMLKAEYGDKITKEEEEEG